MINLIKRKGITFDLCSEEEAIKFLNEDNYYLKVTAYRFNYPKNNNNKYYNLDFFHLMELSILDEYLRLLLLKLCLHVEHSLKVHLLNHMEQIDVDDYKIVDAFDAENPNAVKQVQNIKETSYAYNLIEKFEGNFPIWVLIEFVSFGDLLKFYRFYGKYYNYEPVDPDFLDYIRNLRNACAHNGNLIHDLGFLDRKHFSKALFNSAKDHLPFDDECIKLRLLNPTIRDYTALITVFDRLVLEEEKVKLRYDELYNFFTGRCIKYKDRFIDNPLLTNTYKYAFSLLNAYRG